MTTIAEALDALVRPDKTVAEVLAEEGCRGGHGSKTCPVAVFVRRETGLDARVDNCGRAYGVSGGEENWPETVMPDAVFEFIGEFDHGCYPELEVSDV